MMQSRVFVETNTEQGICLETKVGNFEENLLLIFD